MREKISKNKTILLQPMSCYDPKLLKYSFSNIPHNKKQNYLENVSILKNTLIEIDNQDQDFFTSFCSHVTFLLRKTLQARKSHRSVSLRGLILKYPHGTTLGGQKHSTQDLAVKGLVFKVAPGKVQGQHHSQRPRLIPW